MSPFRLPWALVLGLALATPAGAVAVPCPGAAALAVVADNRSAAGSVEVTVSGELVASSGGCDATGSGLATFYITTMTCSGAGVSKCGRIEGLVPGVWRHRISLDVPGSATQRQAQPGVLVGGLGLASNVVEWTIFGRTFVVTEATPSDLFAQLDAARTFTASSSRPALVRFDHGTFPGAVSPQTIALQTSPTCVLQTCAADGRKTAYCFEGSGVTVDAVDNEARPGGVVLSVGPCDNSLARLYGSDNVLRGLVLQGSQDPGPAIAVDTIAIAGATSRRNRLERCTIVGPTLGDGVSVEGGAGQPDANAAPENVLVESEIRGAEDKGVKVTTGGVARVERSCVHDNDNGGVQATLGGTVAVVESTVQHNVGGPAQNGLFVGVPETVGAPNALATHGNVVRFNGARGVSVVNAATADLEADVVTDNYQAGIRIETTLPGVQPEASVRGGTFACNFAPGVCLSGGGDVCRVGGECAIACSMLGGALTAAKGFGASLGACLDPGCQEPTVDFGPGGDDVGRNAFTLNPNPGAPAPTGINFNTTLTTGTEVPAAGNQWEHCDVPVPGEPGNPNKCFVGQVDMLDVRYGVGAVPLDLGTPIGPRHGPAPVVTAISPARPKAGELVRVYGGAFNAIDGAACHPAGLPADPCAAENPAIVDANDGSPEGNRVTVTVGGLALGAEVHQVTPSMLVFEMPIDCFAPMTLTVERGNDQATPVTLCDPAGCTGRPVGAPCDDGDACTVGESCTVAGTCEGPPLDCSAPCLTGACDPESGCVVRSASAGCQDGDACTVGDHCSGTDATCLAGSPPTCAGACLTGVCDAATGCVPSPSSVSCDDADACTASDHCSGTDGACIGTGLDCDDDNSCTTDACDGATGCTHATRPDGTGCITADRCHGPAACLAGVCDPGPVVGCDDADVCTQDGCDPASGCTNAPLGGTAGVTCHFVQLRTLVGGIPPELAALGRKLNARIDCAEQRAMKALAAAAGSRAQRRLARRGLRCVDRYLRLAERAGDLAASQRAQLGREGAKARAAMTAFFAIP